MGKTDDEVITDPADLPEGGEIFDPTEEQPAEEAAAAPAATGTDCPDCEGRGIRNPDVDRQVCPTCEGRGKIF